MGDFCKSQYRFVDTFVDAATKVMQDFNEEMIKKVSNIKNLHYSIYKFNTSSFKIRVD